MEKITKGNLRFPFEPSLYKGGIKRRKISEAYLNTLVPFKIKNPPQLDNGQNSWFHILPDKGVGV